MTNELIPAANVQLVEASGIPGLLQRVRPQWQAKSLIERVHRLVSVDPSSACQRLFNAAIHDLREKVVIAGLDIAAEAAAQYKLPPLSKDEDVENYPTSKLIDLSYRMGLLTRPEWRRVSRSYEIRRDLEHEDDEYEAGVEDCMYIFSTCVDVILSTDPITLLKISDIKEVVEQSSAVSPNQELLDDFERAPQTRQIEILKFLVGISLDKKQSDIIQQNSYKFLAFCKARAANQTLVALAANFQNRTGRNLDQRHARVATAAGVMPYLKQSARKTLFDAYLERLNEIGTHWSGHAQHGDLLREFSDIGGFTACPEPPKRQILKWMVETYIGVPGGRTSYGNIRHVYYSNSAAPIIEGLIQDEANIIRDDLGVLRSDGEIDRLCGDQHIARRFEKLVDICRSD